MKKLLFLCTALAVSMTVFSQARFGIKGGLNLANQKIEVSVMGFNASQSGDGIVSFHLGGVAEIPVAPHFAFRPELLLSGKGTNMNGTLEDSEEDVEAKVRPFYLELPLNFVYAHDLASGPRLFFGAGPSLAYGIFGKVKTEGQSEDAFQDEGFKRFDFGINILGGVELTSGLTFSVNFTPGLGNIYGGESFEEYDVKWKNTVVGFSVGYMFGKK